MDLTEGLDLLELAEAVAALGFLGGIAAYLLAALLELTRGEVDLGRWFLGGSATVGLGVAVFIALERLN